MSQSRVMSCIEAVVNISLGYAIAVITQILVFPVWGLHASLTQNLGIAATFTTISVLRLYLIRRWFNRLG